MARETGLSLDEARALSEYPNPEVFYEAVIERKRRDRIDLMLDVAQATRAGSLQKDDYRKWMHGMEAERRRDYREKPKTVFEMMKGTREETVFDQMKRGKHGS